MTIVQLLNSPGEESSVFVVILPPSLYWWWANNHVHIVQTWSFIETFSLCPVQFNDLKCRSIAWTISTSVKCCKCACISSRLFEDWELPSQWVKFNPCTNFSSLQNDNYSNPQDPFTEVTENPFQTFLTKVVLSISITFLVLSIAIWVSFKWVASGRRFTAWFFREKISRFAD